MLCATFLPPHKLADLQKKKKNAYVAHGRQVAEHIFEKHQD